MGGYAALDWQKIIIYTKISSLSVNFSAWEPKFPVVPTLFTMPAVVEQHQAACPKPHPYNCKPKQPKMKAVDQPKTSTKPPVKSTHELLTLSDWLEVVNYFDTHQPMTQQELAKYFAIKRLYSKQCEM